MNLSNYYIVQASFYIGVFYLFYWSLLRKEAHFRWNRAYLLGTLALALLIPLLPDSLIKAEWFTPWISSDKPTEENLVLPLSTAVSTEVVQVTFAWAQGLWLIYSLGVMYTTLRLGHSLRKIFYLVHNHPNQQKVGYTLVHLNEGTTSIFSFGPFLFWSNQPSLSSVKLEQIEQHELAHIRQKHTLDVLWLELLCIILWFNPFIYLYKQALRNVHEYLADQAAVQQCKDPQAYSYLLVSQLLEAPQPELIHPFINKTNLKQRIHMLTLAKSTRRHLVKLALVLPVMALCVTMASCQQTVQQKKVKTVLKLKKVTANLSVKSPKITLRKHIKKDEKIQLNKKVEMNKKIRMNQSMKSDQRFQEFFLPFLKKKPAVKKRKGTGKC